MAKVFSVENKQFLDKYKIRSTSVVKSLITRIVLVFAIET